VNNSIPSTQLIIVENHIPLADSREIAATLGVDHRSFFKLITDYQEEIEQDFGQLRFEITVGDRPQGGGNPQKYALLTEDQSYVYLAYSKNTKQARASKRLLVKAFSEAKQHIAQLQQQHLDLSQQLAQLQDKLDNLPPGLSMQHIDLAEGLAYKIPVFMRDVRTWMQKKSLTPNGEEDIRKALRQLASAADHLTAAAERDAQADEQLLNTLFEYRSTLHTLATSDQKLLQ
jgi:phage regulator Rha-like protein